jgi:Pyruvate/2-oxoacid:ferredoxin oxidoreductase delta subunit
VKKVFTRLPFDLFGGKRMSKEVYTELLEVMKKRGGQFAGMDIPEFYEMAEALFTPQEAEVNNAMPRRPATAKNIAQAMGKEEGEMEEILDVMADKGLCLSFVKDQTRFYHGSRFMPGIFEYQFMPGKTTDRDRTIARLIQAYKRAYNQKVDTTSMTFPSFRVITVDKTIQLGNQVHTYDQVQKYIDQSDHVAISTCYCRHSAVLRNEDIHGMPNDVCMQFGILAQFAVERLGAKSVTKAEAKDVLDRAEKAGLIHMSQNTAENIGFICNCDRWHCVVVNSALAKPKPGLFLNSGFEPHFDSEICVACGTCIDRCPPEALTMGGDDLPVVDLDRCFGCAVCATGCPEDAVKMTNKPGFRQPPRDGKALKAAIMADGV